MENTTLSDDIAAFNRSIGLDDTEPVDTTTDVPALATADRDALKAAANQPVSGLNLNAAPTADETAPDYLKDLLAENTQTTPIDWADHYKQAFGETNLPDAIDSDVFYKELVARQSQEQFLAAKEGYRDYKELLNREYGDAQSKAADDLLLVQNMVRQQLGDNLAEAEFNAEFDRKMSFYAEEGQLTADGQKRASAIRQNLTKQLADWERDAKTQSTAQADEVVKARTDYRHFVDSYKPLDLPLDETDAALIKDFALSGQLDERLANLSHEDIALASILFNPHLRAKYFALQHYQRGADVGAKQKLARRLN